MTQVRETSIDAYQLHRGTGKLSMQQQAILICLRHSRQPPTNREIAETISMEPSTVSARRNELIDMGLVKEAGKRKDRYTGIKAYTWTTTRKARYQL